MAILDILETGKQGLTANRQALQTTSHNISNANTPGFSRQRAVLAAVDSGSGPARLGGVELKRVIRVHDQFVQNQLLEEGKSYSAAKSKAETLQRLEGLVHNEAFRMGDLVNKFFNDFRDLSANPETMTLRSNVATSAAMAAEGFRNVNNSIQRLGTDIDYQVVVATDEVNTMAREIAELNGAISQFRARAEEPLELLDRRDGLLRDLSQKIGFQMSVDEHGNTNLSAGGVGILVHGDTFNELFTMRTPENGAKRAGAVDVFIRDGKGQRIVTQAITEGQIGGLVHVRDHVLNPTMKHLDTSAFEFANAVNSVHREGMGADGQAGRNLFEDISEADGAAQRIFVTPDIAETPERIAVGLEPGNGDNRIALQIADLQKARIFSPKGDTGDQLSDGQNRQTLNDSLNTLVGNVATQLQHSDQMHRHREGLLNQLENYRQAISGVNLEEEAIQLVQYQAAFNATAKAMKVGDELLDTILSLK